LSPLLAGEGQYPRNPLFNIPLRTTLGKRSSEGTGDVRTAVGLIRFPAFSREAYRIPLLQAHICVHNDDLHHMATHRKGAYAHHTPHFEQTYITGVKSCARCIYSVRPRRKGDTTESPTPSPFTPSMTFMMPDRPRMWMDDIVLGWGRHRAGSHASRLRTVFPQTIALW